MKLNRLRLPLALFAALCCGGMAQAQFTISEMLFNPGGADDGGESIEFAGLPSTPMTGWFLLIIDGDGTSAGILDKVIDLSAYSTGTNGLMLLRDTVAVLSPAPDVNTAVFVSGTVTDFTPDIENGANTLLLGFGVPPAVNSDLDVGDDGTLDAPLATFTVVDAVSYADDVADKVYADEFAGGTVTPVLALSTCALYRIYNTNGSTCTWAGGNLGAGSVNPGPYTWVASPNQFGNPPTATLDLGVVNTIIDTDADGIADQCDPVLFNAFCFGDGSLTDHTTPCPCGNNGAAGNGCGHSFDPNGANLTANGMTVTDDVQLVSSNEPGSSFTLFMQHDATGDTTFHDGVLCAGGTLIRLRGRGAVLGSASFPNPLWDSSITLSQRGSVTVGSGARRFYAAWYRNASTSFCPPATANVTNGWVIDW
jgi:hypothetical protein